MATPTLNNWENFLLLGVALYAKFINKDWDEFTIDIIIYTVK